MSKQKGGSKAVYIVAFMLLLLGVGYLAITGFQSGSMYFLNVSEALAKGMDDIQQARLFGKVKSQGLERSQEKIGVRFQLADKDDPGQTIWVNYQGAVPDSFQPGVEVIVEGSSSPSGKTFVAHSLMTKCPSKYEERDQD
jgi:cytochrome c-type biogenesis protein CcmE